MADEKSSLILIFLILFETEVLLFVLLKKNIANIAYLSLILIKLLSL